MIANLQGTDAAGNESKQVLFDWVVIAPTSISGPRPLLQTENPSRVTSIEYWQSEKKTFSALRGIVGA